MGQLLEVLKGIQIPSSAHQVVIDADLAYSKRAETASYIQHLETKIKHLQSEVEHLREEKGISGVRDNLTFDEATGTYVGKDGLRYCTRCLSDNKRESLKKEEHGWRCMVCGKRFSDPARPHPLPSSYDVGGGPGGWMR